MGFASHVHAYTFAAVGSRRGKPTVTVYVFFPGQSFVKLPFAIFSVAPPRRAEFPWIPMLMYSSVSSRYLLTCTRGPVQIRPRFFQRTIGSSRMHLCSQ